MMTEDHLLNLERRDLRLVFPETVPSCAVTPAVLTHLLNIADALWLHSGDSKAPHAELTSGKCSDGFVDVLRLLRFSNICSLLARVLVTKITASYHGRVDWVVGSDHAGAAVSHSVAEWLRCQHDFTEKGPDRAQSWKRFVIAPDEVVLQVEELVTTSLTLKAVREGVRRGNPGPVTFVPCVATVVHRSSETEIEGAPILYLAHYDIRTWEPAECPLCAAGSKRLRPKTNWDELTRG